MERAGTKRSSQLDEIAEALPQRSSALSRLFLTRTSVCVSRTEVGVLRNLSAPGRGGSPNWRPRSG